MALSAGTRLGPYEIVAPLGAGGMGEVHRARDTRLERDVAIKVLPQQTADDPSALARLRREAQAIAALQHPGTSSRSMTSASAGDDVRGHGAARMRNSSRPHQRLPASVAEGRRDRSGNRRRLSCRTRQGSHPSRSQAGKCLSDHGRSRQRSRSCSRSEIACAHAPFSTSSCSRYVTRFTCSGDPARHGSLTRTDRLLWIWLSRVSHEWHVWGPDMFHLLFGPGEFAKATLPWSRRA